MGFRGPTSPADGEAVGIQGLLGNSGSALQPGKLSASRGVKTAVGE